MDTTANQTNFSLSALDQSDRMLLSRVSDCVRFASDKNCKKFIGFLDQRGLILAKSVHVGGHCTVYEYGGYDGAERVMLGFYPSHEVWDKADFPIAILTFRVRKEVTLTHRDVLGSLMALGIERECVGDILSEQGRSVVFVKDSVAEHIRLSLDRIGREGVICEQGYHEPLPPAHTFLELRDTVSSNRIDAVVAGLCKMSRGKACEAIACGSVTINGFVCDKNTRLVHSGDTVTVRGNGKYIIDSIDDHTRKNRLIVKARKYM